MQFPIKEKFEISETFLEKYKDIRPNWGFNGLGEFVYMRTYSRLKHDGKNEMWWETVKRVVEGLYSIQKQHILDYNLGWNQVKAQRSAQEMYERIFSFKMIPPGRSLWAMGTDIVMVRGLTESLYNCSFISTKNIAENPGNPFGNAMDFLMLGVGVGFDVQGAGKIEVKHQKEKSHLYPIPDSREGWVESVIMLINSYFGGKNYDFDYSLIRKAGTPIRTFGGVSAGSEPLIELHKGIVKTLNKNIGDLITVTSIANIINMIGKAVVSGNVRRSAEIILGNNESEFLNLKNYDMNPDRMDFGWSSNNTVYGELGMNYTGIANGIKNNAEPGVFWKENAQKYGRMRESEANWKDSRVEGLNPCVSGETLVAVADGRQMVSFKTLAEEGMDVPVYTLNNENKVTIRMMRNPRITGYDVPVYSIKFDDGNEIIATDNHKFLLNTGEYVETKNLEYGDSVKTMSRVSIKMRDNINKKEDKEYFSIYSHSNSENEHRMIASFFSNSSIPLGMVVHHIDGNGQNNSPENLMIVTVAEHSALHSDNSYGENNSNFSGITHQEIKDHAMFLTNFLKRRFSTEEWEYYAKENGLPITFSKWREDSLGGVLLLAKQCATELGFENIDEDPRLVRSLYENIKNGYNCFIENSKITFIKNCEVCGKEFKTERRETSLCSMVCFNKQVWNNSGEKMKFNQRMSFDKKKEKLQIEQINAYNDYILENNKKPNRKQWIEQCQKNKISFEISRKSSPFRYFSDLEEKAQLYNHRVISVNFVGYENVYNGTVDEFHNYAIGGFIGKTSKSESYKETYIFSANCGEITLESSELCNLVEMFPYNHDNIEDFKKTIKYAYLYAKTITLLNTNWPDTNKVMLRNRRIGLSMTGVVQFISKHGMNELKKWMEEGYVTANNYDEIYSDWLAIPKSKKITTTKPSGTVSLLAGATPGIHYPESKYYIRRVRLASNSSFVEVLKNSYYKVEPANEDPNGTVIVEFPVSVGDETKTINDVSMWEQLNLAAFTQENWADNSVSVTVTFKDEEKNSIESALDYYQFKLKAVSFLPKLEKGAYAQMPYEEITKEKYESMIDEIIPLNFGEMFSAESMGEKYCSNDGCSI